MLEVRSGLLNIEPEFFGYGGELSVGAGAAIEVVGQISLVDSSSLTIAIAGPADAATNFGQIRLATSDLGANGELRVVTTGAEPESDDIYPIITCASGDCASGSFDTLDVGALSVVRSQAAVAVRGSDPTLSVSISASKPTATVGVSSISIADLPASAFQGYGGTAADYAASSIETLDLRADLGAPGGGATPVADVTLAELDLATTPITRRLLRSILLPEIPITGGWAERLQPDADTVLVEQSVSLLEIYVDYPDVAAAVTLGELGLEASNLGSISTYAALLAGVSVDQLPVPGGAEATQYWCGLISDARLSCADDFGVLADGSGISNLTLPVLSFAGIDIEQADLLGTPLVDSAGAGIDLSGTPIGENALQDVNLGVVPLASQPLVPSKALPSFLPSTVGVPAEFSGVSFGELAGATPLASLQPAEVGLDGVLLSELDLTAQPESPLVDYQYAPKSVGASLLLTNEDDELPADLAAVPVKDLGASAPILSLPLEELVLPNGRTIGSYRLDELFVDSAPFGVSPFGVSPFGVSPFGVSPFGVSPFGVSPFGVSPFGVSPFGVSPFGVSPFGVSPFGVSPFGVSPFGVSPFGVSPFGVSPFGVSPFGVSPFGVSPFGVSPFGVSPFGVSPFGVSPFGVSPFGVSPFGVSPLSDLGLAAPVTALPLDDPTNPVGGRLIGTYRLDELDPSNLLFDLSIQPFVGWDRLDCTLVDCRQPNGFTIGDALAAGALPTDLTIGDVQLGLAGLTMADLIGANSAFTETALAAFVGSISLTVREAEALGLGVQGIPIQLLSSFGETTIQDARLLFSGYSLVDIAGLAVGLESEDVQVAIENWNGRTADGVELTLGDLTRKIRTDEDGLGDRLWVDNLALSTVAAAAPQLDVDDVWPLLTPLRLEHLTRADGSAPQLTAEAAQRTIGSTIGDSSELDSLLQLEGLLWGDVVGSAGTAPVRSVRDVTVADVVDDFQGITLGEFLRAAQPISDQDSSGIDLSAVDLADYSTNDGVTYSIDVELGGTARTDGLRLVATLPEGGRYVAGTASLAVAGADPGDSVPIEPSLFGDTLVWQLTNVQPDTPYVVSFDVRSPAQVGIVTTSARGQLLNRGVIAQSQTTVEYVEAFEPNDVPLDEGVIVIEPGQIVLSQISTGTDVDLFRFDITSDTVGTRIGATLSSLPADFDLTIIGPSANPLSPTSGRVIESVGDSQLGIGGGSAAATLADGGQYQPPSGLAVIARSTGRGTSTERIDPSPLFVTGAYYLVVSGYDGASSDRSYALQLDSNRPTLESPVCPAGVTFPFAGQGTTPELPPIPADADTLFVVNHQRFGDQYGAQAAQDVLDEIEQLSDSLESDPDLASLDLRAATLDLGAIQAVSDQYAEWDAAPCDLGAVNDVARSISSVLADTYRTNPGIENVVVVGSDRIVPFARLADRTLLGNEQDYALTFGDDLSSPLYAALSAGTFYSDDPYADTTPRLVNDRALYVPERAIGRLVEDPTSIIGQLRSFVEQDGKLRTDSGLVTGYDFVEDSSLLIADRLSSDPSDGVSGPITGETVRLINDDWDAQALDEVLFPQDAPGAGVGAVNGHFSHQGTQSAFGSENDVLEDALFTTDIGTTDFTGSLIYTLGCHSGLSVSEEIGGILGVDWAEALGRAGAGAYVAQTGFGYGSSNSVQLTETLMVDFTEFLDGNFTVGEALKLAKNEYYASLGAISVYDEKSTQQAVLYGLPFAVPDVADPAERPQPPARLALTASGVDGLAVAAVDADVDVVARETDDGTLFEIDGRSYAPQENPLQPITSIDATGPDADGDGLPDQRLHGALLIGGEAYLFGDETGPAVVDPVYQTPTINDGDNEPELQPIDAVYPISPLSVSDSLTEFGARDSVVVQPGRFRASNPDGSGEQALYDNLAIQTLHSDSDDWDAPSVLSVQQSVANGQLSVSIATPSDDVAGVVVAVVENLASSSVGAPVDWRSFELASVDANGSNWSGAYTLTESCTEQLEYLIQIYDEAGNVRVMSNKASGFQATCEDDVVPEPDPALTAVPADTNLDPGGSGWYIGRVTIDVTTTLTGPLAYRIDGGTSVPLVGSSFEIVGNGTRRFTVTASGSDLVATGVVRIDAAGQSPTVAISLPNGSVDAGTRVPIVFSCTDPSRISCVGELTDPNGVTTPVNSGSQVTVIAGTYRLVVTSDDAVTGTLPTVKQLEFTVRAAPPAVISVSGPTLPAPLGTDSVLEIEFTDAELGGDDYTVEFDFGTDPFGNRVSEPCVAASSGAGTTADATCSLVEPSATSPGSATATITYPEPGVYSVTATVTDAEGLESSATYEFVVIFDPGGGRVAGSGIFWSDAASSLGKGPRRGTIGLFGYHARYRNGASEPVGETSLKLLGGLRFKSTEYDYLVINDTIAVAEGSGDVNGQSGYRMRVQGIDNGWVDFFQITIWDPSGELVYDNGILYEDPPDDLRDDRGDTVLVGGIRIRK